MSHFEALFKTYQDLGLKTSVLVLVTRPRPRSELKTLHRLVRGSHVSRTMPPPQHHLALLLITCGHLSLDSSPGAYTSVPLARLKHIEKRQYE